MAQKNIPVPATQYIEQLSLDLFSSSSFEELCAECSPGIALSVHNNTRLKNNWYVKIHRGRPVRELHIPPVLNTAPEAVKLAVIKWAVLPKPRLPHLKKEVRIKRHHYESVIRAYLDTYQPKSDRPPPKQQWPTQGVRYDLSEVFSTVNNRHFNGTLRSFLRWGTVRSKTSYQSTRRGPDGTPYHCITIAGVYNHPDVPRFAIESIMYHEMLHIHVPPRRENGRNVFHGRDFKQMEQAFPHYREWRQWEREVLPHLRYSGKTKKRIGTTIAKLFFT